jgi:hypothetical protein
MRVLLVIAITLGSTNAAARPDCEGEARELRAHLTAESHRANNWNTAWAFLFGAATLAQAVVAEAEFKPFGEFDAAFEEQMYVGTIKAALGLGSKIVLPLHITVPPKADDACVDARALRKAIEVAAHKERRSIWLTIIGGTAVNLAGTIWLWARHDLKTGLTSFASGVPVGPISAWTQPRGSMKYVKQKRVQWVAGVGWFGGVF